MAVTRRQFLAWGTAAGTALFLPTAGASRAGWERIDAARDVLDGAEPRSSGIRLDLPSVSQDGSSISLTAEVDSPMTEDDYIEALHLYAAGNPTPEIATLRFQPRAGKARVGMRIRLDESQRVVALARTSQGQWLTAEREVRVTSSGCLVRADTYASDNLFQTRIRVPDSFRSGEPGEILTLIQHPMETGLREDDDGEKIPKRIIEHFAAELDGQPVVEAEFFRSVAANPYLRFFVSPQESGELELTWREDTGEKVVESRSVRV